MKQAYVVVRVEQLTRQEADRICLSGEGQALEIPIREFQGEEPDCSDVSFDVLGCQVTLQLEVTAVDELPTLDG